MFFLPPKQAALAVLAADPAYAAVTTLRCVRDGPLVWVFVDEQKTIVIRLIKALEPKVLYTLQAKEADLLAALRARGAPVEKIVLGPVVYGDFVVSVTPYLPGEMSNYYQFGQALAKLHNAGTMINSTALALFDPLLPVQKTYEYIKKCEQTGMPFGIGETLLSAYHIEILQTWLAKEQKAVAEMVRLSRKRGYQLTVLHHDIHPANARVDTSGNVILFDIDTLSMGPAEYDLARPLGQWVQRFGRPKKWVREFMQGYHHTVTRLPDPGLLALAIDISMLHYGLSMVTREVDAAMQGTAINETHLAEGVKRLEHLDEPDFRWKSRETYLKQANRDDKTAGQ